jgi:RHS repeat-associated protein
VFDAAGESAEVLWLLGDHQGTVRDIVSDAGQLRKHVDYDSFGKVTGEQFYSKSGAAIAGTHAEAIDQLFYYTGQERDATTGLQQHGARWYNPTTGRFLSEDPIGFDAGDPNLYRYTGNGVTYRTDPTGLTQAGNPLFNLFPGYTSALGGLGTSIASSSAYKQATSIGNSIFTAGRNLFTSDAGRYNELVGLTNRYDSISSQIDVLQGLPAPIGHGSTYTYQQRGNQFRELSSARATTRDSGSNLFNNIVLDAQRVDIVSNPGGTEYVSYAGAFGSGLKTGGKAVGNATASSLSLGFYDGPFGVTQQDIYNGYNTSRLIAGLSTELLVGVGTGGLSRYGAAGKAALAFDTGSNVLNVGRGVNDAYNNGLGVGNGVQIVGGAFGLGGNVAAGGRALQEIASDASRLRVSFDPSTLSAGGLGGVKVHLNSNIAVGNFGVYDLLVDDTLYKVGKADLGRVTQSTGLPTRVHQQVRKLEQLYPNNRIDYNIQSLGSTTTSQAKVAEVARLQSHYSRTGIIPIGNQKSFRPNP